MIRKSIALMFLLLMTVSAYAETPSKWSFGVKAGLNISNAKLTMDGWTDISNESVAKFAFGLTTRKPINKIWSFAGDVMIIGRGSKMSGKVSGVTFSEEAEISNFAIAPSVQCQISDYDKNPIFLSGGLELDLNSSADWKSGGSIQDYQSSFIYLNLGAGSTYKLTKGSIVPELRYTMGLANESSASGVTFKSNGIMLSVSYLFD